MPDGATGRTPSGTYGFSSCIGTGTATAGCVSLPIGTLRAILRWLRPGDRPRIIISAR